MVQCLRFWVTDQKVCALSPSTTKAATVRLVSKALKPDCSGGAVSWLTMADPAS